MLDGFEDPGHEGFAEGHALAECRVVATGEVDPLEAARVRSAATHFFDLDGAVALHDEPLAGLQFLDLGVGALKAVWMTRRSDGDHHLVVLVPEAGANAVGVAGDKEPRCR